MTRISMNKRTNDMVNIARNAVDTRSLILMQTNTEYSHSVMS